MPRAPLYSPIITTFFVRYRTEAQINNVYIAIKRFVFSVKAHRANNENSKLAKERTIMIICNNTLLSALLSVLPDKCEKKLELVPLELGKVLYESGEALQYVYFPVDAIVSLLFEMSDGASAEISVVGNEGIVGIAVFLGGGSTPSRAIVQSEGKAYRVSSTFIKQAFNHDPAVRVLLLRYTLSLRTQMSQTAVCNRHHTIVQQLCRWILLSLDRLPNNNLVMTQELIANMLGVRREGVTEAAGKLQKAGVITYKRGHIKVIDRPKLERMCCECYQVVKEESDRLEAFAIGC
jgi:CRP-like cAMP-binding protein